MKKPRFRRHFRPRDIQPGFQIAPMIDVVFVILLFFMVATSARKKENEHTTKLPGDILSCPPVVGDEVVISIDADGQVYLNDEPVDAPGVEDLPDLTATMTSLGKSAADTGVPLEVVIRSETTVKYQRIVNVLDALARAKVRGVGFETTEEP